MVVAVTLVAAPGAGPATTCMLRLTTGIPCPCCGGTRVVLHLADGEPGRAFLMNPGVFLALAVGSVLLLLRLVARRRVVIDLSSRGRRAAFAAALALLAANWAYVVVLGA
jgi:hypothetical protein